MREYGIDIAERFYTISWRRFIVLLSGLSGDSAFLNVILNAPERQYDEDNPEIIAADLARLFAG